MTPTHTTGRTWTITRQGHTWWSINQQIKWHHHQRAQIIRETRQTWKLLAQQHKIPPLNTATITVTTTTTPPHRPHDTGNEHPTVKAAIDGLIDAHVLPNDTPKHLHTLTFHAPQKANHNSLTLTIHELTHMQPYDHQTETNPQYITLDRTTAKALIALLNTIPITDPHTQRIATDIQHTITQQGIQ